MRRTAARLFSTVALATSLVTIAGGTALAGPTVVPAATDMAGVGATPMARPNGAGSGLNALDTLSGTTVDFGRTDRPPQTGDLTAGWIRQHGAADIQSHGSQFLPGDWCGATTRI